MWENWIEIKLLYFFIDNWIINLFGITRIIPEFDRVIDTLFKEESKILSYNNRLDLIRMRWWIKYMSC